MQRFKTIYFIYNADGGLLNEVKYWVNKNIFKRPTACELCDISHGKIFVKSEWLKFINDLQRDYKVEVLHRNEIPRKILPHNPGIFQFPLFNLPLVYWKSAGRTLRWFMASNNFGLCNCHKAKTKRRLKYKR